LEAVFAVTVDLAVAAEVGAVETEVLAEVKEVLEEVGDSGGLHDFFESYLIPPMLCAASGAVHLG
jgi:hypothetical protein